MKWVKKGLIFKAQGQFDWMYTHIQNPYAVKLQDRVRIYFTTRPKPINGLFRSVTAFVDLDINNLNNILGFSPKPILEYGEAGAFDENGIMPGSIVFRDKEVWLYYAGWQRGVTVPYFWSIGLAISKDGGITFEKFGNGPIMSLNYDEPYLLAAPRSVFFAKGKWHMLYGSGTGWIQNEGKIESMYLNRHAVSSDGIHWIRDKEPCVEKVYEDESQSACVTIEKNGRYHMFFPYRHSYNFRNPQRSYRIGYAYSDDLTTWIRDDKNVGITVSETGWDSEQVCYPHVIELDRKWIMFYCGNGFGVGGLGWAELGQ